MILTISLFINYNRASRLQTNDPEQSFPSCVLKGQINLFQWQRLGLKNWNITTSFVGE